MNQERSSRKRTPVACEFCRRRKMKCTNERPVCRNCKEHGKDCVYVQLEQKPRPSTGRIKQLEEEVQRLQTSLEALREPPCLSTTSSSDAAVGSSLSSGATSAEKMFSPDTSALYHGPPSAVFDEKSNKLETRDNIAKLPRVSDIWIERQLVAESAKQRQLENVNLLAGKLDFDGVDPGLGMHLLTIYWSRQLSSSPLIYRTAFMRDMACSGPYYSKLLLNAIYFYASKYTSRTEVRRDSSIRLTAGWVFRQRAVELLSGDFGESKITTIQALLLMSNALFWWCDEKSKSWLYSGMAFNMIVDLGIHIDPMNFCQQFTEEDLEVRHRVFWSAFVLDKIQSLYQGRPTRLHRSGSNLSINFLDKYEEFEIFNSLTYTELANNSQFPVYSLSTFSAMCRLSIVLEKMIQSLYSERSQSEDLLQECNALHSELENWRSSLPPHLDFNSSDLAMKCQSALPNILSLRAMYNLLIILLHRPFVSDGHLHSSSVSIALDAFSTCSAAAFEIDQILRTYERSLCFKSSPDLISYATYVSATIHVRLATQREHGSEAHRALRKCLDVIEIQQEESWSGKRAKRVIGILIARMGVSIGTELHGDNFDPAVPGFDIEEIIRSFSQNAQTSSQQIPSRLDGCEGCSDVETSSILLPCNTPANNNHLATEQMMPLDGDEMSFLYDPIFGFNGSAFDNLDIEFQGSFL